MIKFIQNLIYKNFKSKKSKTNKFSIYFYFIISSQTSGIVSCVFTHTEELILTGSASGSICVHLLDTGNFITKLDLHRSMVTGIIVNSSDDIFASCSTDGVVNISSLADFCMLNQIVLTRPILHMDVSLNSTFLMLSCDDNSVYICALSTGTQIHCIEVSGLFFIFNLKFKI